MDQEQDNEKQKALARHIATLELEISTWGAHNSQSNPGAVMELRDMKRDLAAAYKEFHARGGQSPPLKPPVCKSHIK